MAEIRVFHTHIEVYPYELGQSKRLEKLLSKWNGFTYVPFGFFIQNDILYLPRGISTELIEELVHGRVTVVTKCDPYTKIKKGVPTVPPKGNIQANGIKFLAGLDEYAYTSRYSQLGLNMATGDGKTYATVAAILKLKMKAIIITPLDKLRIEWYNTIVDKTSFPEDEIYFIDGSNGIESIMKGKVNKEIYLVNHQTLHSYASEHGYNAIRDFFKKIKVGIKVIDEADVFFHNTLMLDFFSNCYKSIYVTATFGRSDPAEVALFKRAFASLARYGEETVDSEERRKHIVFVIVYFQSHPKWGMAPNVNTYKGFSSYKYIDYELSEENHSLEKVVYNILDQTKDLEGQTMILSPKKESVRFFAEKVSEYVGEPVGTIYSDNSSSVNSQNQVMNYISSTRKSSGRGVNIKKLRKLILLEPVGSGILMDQIAGRLREYSPEHDTFIFYPVDTAIEETVKMLNRTMKVMKRKGKSIEIMRLNV